MRLMRPSRQRSPILLEMQTIRTSILLGNQLPNTRLKCGPNLKRETNVSPVENVCEFE